MSGMTLGDIMSILAEKCGGLTLHEAMYTARGILELSNSVTDSVAQESYNKGHVDGYEQGKSDGETSVSTLEAQKQTARRNIADIVRKTGSHKKIQCIKEIRNLTGLGLKDSKDIVEQYVRGLDRFASWERELVDPLYVPRAY